MYVVMERGDVDLSTVLKNRRKTNSTIDENSIRCGGNRPPMPAFAAL